jgi:hypothetical protein
MSLPTLGAVDGRADCHDAEMSSPSDGSPSPRPLPVTGPPPTVARALGHIAVTLRDNYWFAGAIALGTLVAGISAFIADENAVKFWVLGGAIATAGGALGDWFADRHESILLEEAKETEKDAAVQAEIRAERAIEELNFILTEAHAAMFLTGASRRDAIQALPRTFVRSAAALLGDGSRASYYQLSDSTPGARCLTDPVHGKGLGRSDEPPRPFLEAEAPDHDVWRIMDRPDVETAVRSEPEAVGGVVWDRVQYTTFYSVPVKAKNVQFGFLSVNSSVAGSIGGPQRATVLAIARILALVLAGDTPPRELQTAASSTPPSDGRATFGPVERQDGE